MSANLDLARAKLANPAADVPPYPFEDLPTDWNAFLWNEIRKDYGLSLPEFGALQTARCGQPPQAALGRQLPMPAFYVCKPTDKRIKSTLIIVNETISPPRELSAVVLCDGGAMGDKVTLSARKILQLGLKPAPAASGGIVHTKSANNTLSTKLVFIPQVTVRIQFTRPGSTQIEERGLMTHVSCSEDDWNAAVAHSTASSSSLVPETNSPIPEPSSPIPVIPLGPHIVAAVQLSPIGEGIASDRSNETCAVGEGLLEKLGAHSNHVHHILEIEEELIEEE